MKFLTKIILTSTVFLITFSFHYAEVPGKQNKPLKTKFENGYAFSPPADIFDKDGAKLGRFALFHDQSRKTITAGDTKITDAILKSVADNSNQLEAASPSMIKMLLKEFNLDVITPKSKNPAQKKSLVDMLCIAAFPAKGAKIKRAKWVKNPIVFVPGQVKSLEEIKSKYGVPDEEQQWSMPVAKQLGISGIVSWWGRVGVAINPEGTITHVFLRFLLN
jgi:hypothetical protein